MLQILLWLLIILIFFLITVILLPYHYAFSFDFKEKLYFKVFFSVLFLKLFLEGDLKDQSLHIKILNFKKKLNFDKEKSSKFNKDNAVNIIKEKIENKISADKKQEKAITVKKNKNGFKFDFSLLNKENFKHLFSFIIRMLKILKVDYLKLNLLFSFADPYYNGLFLAFYYTIKELFDYPDLKVKINWQEVVFEADGSAAGSIVPLRVLFELFKFVFSVRSFKIYWKLYQANKKKG